MADTDLQAETPKTTGVTDDTLFFGALTGTGEAVADTITGAAVAEYIGGRELLTGDRTYYVRTDGSNSNDGLANTVGGAWATIQHAWDTIVGTIDQGGHAVTIQMADGTYTSGLLTSVAPANGYVIIQGNAGSSEAVIWKPASIPDFGILEAPIVGALCYLIDVQLDATDLGPDYAGVYVYNFGCNWQLSRVCFKACTYGMYLGSGATLGSNTMQSRGTELDYYAYLENAASLGIGGVNTIDDTPGVTSFVFLSNMSNVTIFNSGSFSGSATGQRYYAEFNSTINTGGGGANFFPGDVGGATATGGQYG